MTEPSEIWREGDLAVCIEHGPWFTQVGTKPTLGPEREEIARVYAVYAELTFPGDPGVTGLGLEFIEFPNEIFPARCFRRIRPDHGPGDDARLIALIKGARVGART
jgi:hypothetical protein